MMFKKSLTAVINILLIFSSGYFFFVYFSIKIKDTLKFMKNIIEML